MENQKLGMDGVDNLSSKELRSIISEYKLGEIKSYKELSNRSVQTNILIQTTTNRLVLKYYKNRNIEYVKFETKLLEYLNTKEYCSPKIYKNKKGKLLTSRCGKAIILTEWIQGEHLEKLSALEFVQLVSKIAELHLLTENLQIKGIEHRWNYNIDFCKKYLKGKTETYRKARQIRKKNWLERELDTVEIKLSIPKGIIHADLHYTNFFFLENKLNAIIDFDDANYSYLIYDILCLIDTRREKESFLNREYFKTSKEVIQKYQRIRELQEEEKRSLYDVLLLSILIDSFWFYNRGKYPNFKEKKR